MSAEQNVPEVQSHQGPPPTSDSSPDRSPDRSSTSPSDRQEVEPRRESSSFSEGEDSSSGGSVPHGMGQSKSSRRRRRKRKGKGSDAAAESPQSEQAPASGSISSLQASAPPPGNPGRDQNSFQAAAAGGGHQANSGPVVKRWKKKFRDRDRDRPRRDDNPGNQAAAGSSSNGSFSTSRNGGSSSSSPTPHAGAQDSHQFGNRVDGWKSRKNSGGSNGGGGGKQRDRGPRSFVGPMDHSYRVVNGNFADTPPSTIEQHGNGGGGGRPRSYHTSNDSQPIDYSQGRIIPVADDAPTRILFFIDDLFFIAKIQETARKLGVKIAFIKNEKEELAKLTGGEEADRPALIVFDLNNANAKPLTLIPKLKAKLKRSTSIIGFLSHLQGDLKAKAVEAGCDTVMPRAAFSQNLPNLLRRYGLIEEKEEANFNQ